LVVDDEPMICKGVASILLNADIAITEIFIAHNGFEALDFIRLEKIDLILTDIQMEQMNGIELIETIFVENPGIPIIVLSAHGEFEYAQKALRFGVKEYIVKPVNPLELIQVTKALLLERETRLRSLSDATFNHKFSFEDMATNRNYILNELVSEGINESEIDEIFTYLGYRFDGPYYSMLVIRLDLTKAGLFENDITSFRDRNLLKYASLNVIEETLEKWESIVFYSSSNTISVVLQFSEEEMNSTTRLNQQTMIAQLLHNHLLTFINMKSVIGISRIKAGIKSWLEIYQEATEAIRWSEIHRDHNVFYIEDFGKHGEALLKWGSRAAESIIETPVNQRAQSIGHVISKLDDMITSQIDEDNNSFIHSTIQYIDKNFRQKGLKLQEIADSVYLSPNYLSYLFKKIVGINLWDYVTKLRMEEGKRLILTTDKRRYEISDEIGYESPEHFSKIFKKHFGINPSEIKN
jgi:two-component system response regulator YesN